MEHARPSLLLALAALTLAASSVATAGPPQLHPAWKNSSLVEAAGLCASVVDPLGYACQQFEIQTADGYLLTIHRIPQGRRSGGGNQEKRQPVLLQHGVLMDGTQWVLGSPELSLPFILADEGFDVWISNIRGTRWSCRHVSLDHSAPAYWAWSWDELAEYDLAANVDFVLNKTGQKLHYVGHSMGTTIMLAALSERKLVDKLKSTTLLSPVAYLTRMRSQLAVVAARLFTGEILNRLGLAEFNPKGKAITDLLMGFCRVPGVNCYDLLSSITGNNCCLNGSTVDIVLQYEPQPTSVKTMIHFAQTFRDGVVAKYNYDDSEVNSFHYGRSQPPAYDMSMIPPDFPMLLSYGGQDFLSDVGDVERLLNDLKGHRRDKLSVQFVEQYGHVDFVMAFNAKTVVYDGVIKFMNTHS